MSSKDIQLIKKTGKRRNCKHFTANYIRADDFGICIAASKKLGNAVTRNKIRRRLKGAFGKAILGAGSGFWMIVYPKFTVKTVNFSDLITELAVVME